jgi:hypothetical protein
MSQEINDNDLNFSISGIAAKEILEDYFLLVENNLPINSFNDYYFGMYKFDGFKHLQDANLKKTEISDNAAISYTQRINEFKVKL